MKRIYTTLLLAAITLFACQTVSAYDFEVDGIYYNLNTSDMTATVTSGNEKYTGEVVIPSSVTYNTKTLKVAKIGGYAFSGCTSLTSVTIPNSVTKIGSSAFSGCTSLTSVTIPNSVTEINRSAFLGCTSLTSVTIPNSVTVIENDAFSGCTSLTSITIPNSVEMIYMGAFMNCTSLTSIMFPNSVTVIGENAFSGCTSLTSIMLPNSVTEIIPNTFSGCTSLTSITIPNSVTTIGKLAFSGCTSLSTVVLSENLTKIEEKAFQNCSQLTTITIPGHVTSIDRSAFYGCESLQKLTLEDSDQPLRVTASYSDEASRPHPTFLYLGREVKDEYKYTFLVSDSVETLVFGNTYTSQYHPEPTKIKTIISKIEKPHSIQNFSNRTYIDVTLYVPKGTKALYESTDGWRQFFNIQEGDPTTGIVSTKDDVNKVEVSRYDIRGQRLSAPRKGINIVRYSDGTTAKIVVQ